MRFNLLRSTATAWVCLLGLTLFAHATLADSSSLSGNAVGTLKVKHASVDEGTVFNAGRRSHEHKTPSIDNGFIVEAHDAQSHKTSSVDNGALKPASVNDDTFTLTSVDDGAAAAARSPHAHEQELKPVSVGDGTLLTKGSNNAHETREDDAPAKSIRALLNTGVDVQAAKRIVDTKTRGLGQVSEAPGTGLEPAKRGKYWCMLCQCC